jgi:hypothetical protein
MLIGPHDRRQTAYMDTRLLRWQNQVGQNKRNFIAIKAQFNAKGRK